VTGPVLIGIVNAPPSRAQSKPEALTFEVASVKPADPNARQVSFQFTPGGGLNAVNVGLKQLISFAYGIPCGKNCDNLISGAPRGPILRDSTSAPKPSVRRDRHQPRPNARRSAQASPGARPAMPSSRC